MFQAPWEHVLYAGIGAYVGEGPHISAGLLYITSCSMLIIRCQTSITQTHTTSTLQRLKEPGHKPWPYSATDGRPKTAYTMVHGRAAAKAGSTRQRLSLLHMRINLNGHFQQALLAATGRAGCAAGVAVNQRTGT